MSLITDLVGDDVNLHNGITAARLDYNNNLTPTVVENGIEVSNPNILTTDEDYIKFVVKQAARSYARRFNGYIDEEAQELTPEKFISQVILTVQKLLDDTAASRGYGDDKTSPSTSISTYDNDPNPKFAAEAAAFKSWRSSVWTTCYQILDEVNANMRPAPTSVTEVIDLLPQMIWTN